MSVINQSTAFPSESFHWDAAKRIFSEEASTLQFHNVVRLFDDACDEGILIRSTRSGKVEAFYLAETKRDADGDVTVWKFQPVKPDLNCTVLIYND